jgi:hypothetical protein
MVVNVLGTRKKRSYLTGEAGLRRWFREGSTHGGGKCLDRPGRGNNLA